MISRSSVQRLSGKKLNGKKVAVEPYLSFLRVEPLTLYPINASAGPHFASNRTADMRWHVSRRWRRFIGIPLAPPRLCGLGDFFAFLFMSFATFASFASINHSAPLLLPAACCQLPRIRDDP
jgi:hypothetical protein